ncbi:unnamed protein product [Thlaspi arvense]|uniref:Uncharacterized protein n=1 Tax=Thlaspi arvense TaxID=13288 RepID=A0AAU9T5I5_THLAR|nr:unnamed protein product [Thlaspi arvense]
MANMGFRQDAHVVDISSTMYLLLQNLNTISILNQADDGLHLREPWVFRVEQEIEKLVTKVEEQSKTIKEMRKQIQIQAEEIAKLNVVQQFP